MSYRGEDLDLRTPQGWGQNGRETQSGSEPNWWTRSTVYNGGRADPIWVDDSVMACCNHAFDLAIAHRAPEVRLEHLLNAMTLNDVIAQVLAARGIGVAQLRRESGAILASEVPAGPINGKLNPKRSEALEETLRLAADRAYPRRTPVTVDDILHVLFDMQRDLPGLQLLRRHSAPWSQRNGALSDGGRQGSARQQNEARPDIRLEPLPHLTRPPASFTTEPLRYASAEEQRPRYVMPAAQDYYQPTAPQGPLQSPPPGRFGRDREPAGASVDALQNNRLDALDRAVRDLGLDQADDRKSLQSIVTDLQRQSATQADDTSRFRGGLSERLNSLEDAVLRARAEPAQVSPAIFERLSGIERNIDQRLSEAARTQPSLAAVTDRLAAMERMLDQRIAEIGRGWAAVGERLLALEQVATRPDEPMSMPPLLAARLETVGGLEQKLDSLERTFSLILDRMTGIERQLGTNQAKPVDLAPMQARLDTRLGDLERNVVTRVAQSVDLAPVTELLSGIETRVAGLERSIENRSAETGRTVSFIGERLRSFEETVGDQKAGTGDRLGQIERSLTAYAERTIEAGSAHEHDLSELHEALVKLNANQQTLAGSLEQWRLDNTGDLSVVSNRLKLIEVTTQRRDGMVDTLASQITAIHNVVAKREVHKSRFRNWLLGTDEWYSASYDTESWRARQAVDILRGLEGRPQLRSTPAAPPPPRSQRA